MAKSRLEGILLPMPTPFHEDGRLDEGSLEALVEFYVSAGVQGLFVLGTHGQGMVMEIEERKKTAEIVAKKVKERIPFVLHVGTANTLSSVELAKHAARLGPHAIALVPPYYYPHNDYEIFAHYRNVAAAVSGTPLFIYDNPLTTRVHLPPAKVLKLLEEVPDICGIKVSYGEFGELASYVQKLPDTLGVFPGSILSYYPGYSLGVRGAIHPPTTPFPEVCVQLYKALKDNDAAGAQSVFQKIVELLSVLNRFMPEHGRAVFFESMRLRGLPVKRFPRWECKPFIDRERQELKEGIETVGLQLNLG